MAIQIIRLPATMDRFTADPIGSAKPRRTAAYARVSTDHADQLTSYAAQVSYYTEYIKSRPELDFVGVYTDEGITGTSTVHRDGFRQMVADAVSGKIDLIITKSVSRFARNTVDSLSTIRLLKEHGVECYFEKENICTFDSKGELLLTIMSSLAQEEARSISENCTWGQRKRFADGKATVPFSRFLGYDRGEDGGLVVNEEQAQTVRRIYQLFLQGETTYGIAKLLTWEGVPTPGGGKRWSRLVIESILTNEKYKGDALLQKAFTVDYLTKRKKLNEGEVPQYYVKDSHEGIVTPELFAQVQQEFERRRDPAERTCADIFSSRLKCGVCGGNYEPEVIHSTHRYRRTLWKCTACGSAHLMEAEIRAAFVGALNSLTPEKRAELLGSPAPLADFDERLWCALVDRMIVHDKTDICILFRDGTQVKTSVPTG